jgi:hypothetical protein
MLQRRRCSAFLHIGKEPSAAPQILEWRLQAVLSRCDKCTAKLPAGLFFCQTEAAGGWQEPAACEEARQHRLMLAGTA